MRVFAEDPSQTGDKFLVPVEIGNLPGGVSANPIPIGNMDMTMSAPFHFDPATKTLSLDAAGATAPGVVTLNQIAAYAGANGKSVLSGTGAPGAGVGSNGDFYVDTAATTIYGPKASGAWGSGVSLIGTPGTVWRNGSGAPSNGTGINGDYYLNTANGDIYQRASGTYSVVGNIKGAAATNPATLVGTVSIAQTASIAISAGIREVAVTLSGAVVGARYMAFCRSYTLNGGSSVNGRPAGYTVLDCACNTTNQITVSLNAPLLAIGSAYTMATDIVQINT